MDIFLLGIRMSFEALVPIFSGFVGRAFFLSLALCLVVLCVYSGLNEKTDFLHAKQTPTAFENEAKAKSVALELKALLEAKKAGKKVDEKRLSELEKEYVLGSSGQ